MLANSVSPPVSGTTLPRRMVAIGGASRKVSSTCQMSVSAGGLSAE